MKKFLLSVICPLVALSIMAGCSGKEIPGSNSTDDKDESQQRFEDIFYQSRVTINGHTYILIETSVPYSDDYAFQLIHDIDSCGKCLDIYD